MAYNINEIMQYRKNKALQYGIMYDAKKLYMRPHSDIGYSNNLWFEYDSGLMVFATDVKIMTPEEVLQYFPESLI